ncbi:MAG: hypothetical protein U1D55_00865 [Phycisphaerae bacterium]
MASNSLITSGNLSGTVNAVEDALASGQPLAADVAARASHYCKGCGYILDGLPEERCPECGRAFSRRDPRTYLHTRRVRWSHRVVRAVKWGALTALTLTPISCLAFRFAYYTDGEVGAGVTLFGWFLGCCIALATAVVGSRRVTVAVVLLLAAILVGRQALLGIRLWALEREARHLVAWIEAEGVRAGSYPAGLPTRAFRDASLSTHFGYTSPAYTNRGQVPYELRWWVFDDHIAYWYNELDGYAYYAD